MIPEMAVRADARAAIFLWFDEPADAHRAAG